MRVSLVPCVPVNEAAAQPARRLPLVCLNETEVYAEIVHDCAAETLQTIIHSDGRRGYDGQADIGCKKHFHIDHGQVEFTNESTHINGIEVFCGFSKTRLAKFHGISKTHFYLHLKECEFRFNNRSDDMYHSLLQIIRNKPLA